MYIIYIFIMFKQDDAEDCLGEMFVSEMILNDLEVEQILRVDMMEELNDGCNIDIKNNIVAYEDIGISGCLYLSQPLINLRNNSGLDNRDIGFFSAYQDTGVTYYTGLVRDATDKKYKLFDKATNINDLCGEVDFTGITYADLELGKIDIKFPLSDSSFKVADTVTGDLMVGITGEFRALPVGLPNQILTVDPDSELGVTWAYGLGGNLKSESGSWFNDIPDFQYSRISSNLTLINKNKYTRVFRKNKYGNKTFSVTNELENAPSALFHTSKSQRDYDGHIVKLTGLSGLKGKWTRRTDIEIAKCREDKDGDYLAIANYDPDCAPENIRDSLQYTIDLIGTTWTTINSSELRGNYIYHIDNDLKGPTGIFYATKSNMNFHASISRVTQSFSDDFNKLELRWLPNSKIQIRKTKSTYDGNYRLIPIHEQYITQKIIELTGNNFANEIFIDEYERITTIVSVENIITDGASAIFTISKSHIDHKLHISKIVSQYSGEGWDKLEIIGIDPPSAPSNCLIVNPFEIVGVPRKCALSNAPSPENIELVWNEDELLKIRKNNNAIGSELYDGLYRVRIYEYYPC